MAPRVVKAMVGDVVEIQWHAADGSVTVVPVTAPPRIVREFRGRATCPVHVGVYEPCSDCQGKINAGL